MFTERCGGSLSEEVGPCLGMWPCASGASCFKQPDKKTLNPKP